MEYCLRTEIQAARAHNRQGSDGAGPSSSTRATAVLNYQGFRDMGVGPVSVAFRSGTTSARPRVLLSRLSPGARHIR